MKWPKCIYFAAGASRVDVGQLMRSLQELHDNLFALMDGKVDGYNLASSLFDEGFTVTTQTQTTGKRVRVTIADSTTDTYFRLKGTDGMELIVDASHANGRFCILDKDYLSQQLISLIPEDPFTVVAPGGTFKTTYGTMIFEGFAGDEIVFNESSIDVNFRVESNGNANAIFVDAGTDRVGVFTAAPGVPLDVTGTIRTDTQLISTQATGTAPLAVSSTTKVTNLNADRVDDAHASATPTASTIPIADGSNKLAAGWISEVLATSDLSDSTGKTGTGEKLVSATAAGTGAFCPRFNSSGNLVDSGYRDGDTPGGANGGSSVLSSSGISVTGLVTATTQLVSQQATGTAPIDVQSTTKVSNLNADRVDDAHASATPTASTIPIADGSGKLAAGWGGSASTLATLDSDALVPTAQMGSGSASADVVLKGNRTWAAPPRPKGFMQGLQGAWLSTTTFSVGIGACRNSTDDGDLALTAAKTVDVTTVAAFASTHGLDQVTAAATATTHGTATFEPSASLWSETAMAAVVRTLTGTFSTVGTAGTGSGSLLLTGAAPGDVIRSATKGAARITAISSNTGFTLSNALPGGDCTAEAATLYENLTIWPDTGSAGDQRRVNTISHAGTSVIVSSALTSNGASKVIRLGVEVASMWFFPYVATDGTDTIALASGQRTKPLLTTITKFRRIPFELANFDGGSANDILFFEDRMGGETRFISRGKAGNASGRVLSAGVQFAAYTAVDASIAVPPTAAAGVFIIWLNVALTSSTTQILYVRSAAQPESAAFTVADCTSTVVGNSSSVVIVSMSSAGLIFYILGFDPQTSTPAYIDTTGWWSVAP